MKKIFEIILIFSLVIVMTGCFAETEAVETKQITKVEDTESIETVADVVEPESTEPEPVETEENIEDSGWDELEALGKIETENGVFVTTVTFPKDFVGDDITQEEIDSKSGEKYIAGILNEDGSVSYKLNKKQHKEMMDGIAESIENSLKDMVDGADYSYTEIKHNNDYTEFDVIISGEDLTLTDSIGTLGFYMYGGMYGIFTGHRGENIVVNYYNSNGDLISSSNSDNMGD